MSCYALVLLSTGGGIACYVIKRCGQRRLDERDTRGFRLVAIIEKCRVGISAHSEAFVEQRHTGPAAWKDPWLELEFGTSSSMVRLDVIDLDGTRIVFTEINVLCVY